MFKLKQNSIQSSVAVVIFMNMMLDIKKMDFLNNSTNKAFKDAVCDAKNLAELIDVIAKMPGKARLELTNKLLDWLKKNQSHELVKPKNNLLGSMLEERKRKDSKVFYNIALYYIESALKSESHKTEKAHVQRTLVKLEERMQLIEEFSEFVKINNGSIDTTNEDLKWYYEQSIKNINTWLAGLGNDYNELDKIMLEKDFFDKKMNAIRNVLSLAGNMVMQEFISNLDELNDKLNNIESDHDIPDEFKASLKDFYAKKITLIKEQPQSINTSNLMLVKSTVENITAINKTIKHINNLEANVEKFDHLSSVKMLIESCIEKARQNVSGRVSVTNCDYCVKQANGELAIVENVLNSIDPKIDNYVLQLKADIASLPSSSYLDGLFAPVRQFIDEWDSSFKNWNSMFQHFSAEQIKEHYSEKYQQLLQILEPISLNKIKQRAVEIAKIRTDIAEFSGGKIDSKYIDACLKENFALNSQSEYCLKRLQEKIAKRRQQKELVESGGLTAITYTMKTYLAKVTIKKQLLEAAMATKELKVIDKALKELQTILEQKTAIDAIKTPMIEDQLRLLYSMKPDESIPSYMQYPKVKYSNTSLHATYSINVNQAALECMLDFHADDSAMLALEQLNTTSKLILTREEIKPIYDIIRIKEQQWSGAVSSLQHTNQQFDWKINEAKEYFKQNAGVTDKVKKLSGIGFSIERLNEALLNLEKQIDSHQKSVSFFVKSIFQSMFSKGTTDKQKLGTQKSKIKELKILLAFNKDNTSLEDTVKNIELAKIGIREIVREMSEHFRVREPYAGYYSE